MDRDLLDNLRNTSLQLVSDYGYRGVEVDEHEGFRVLMGLLAALTTLARPWLAKALLKEGPRGCGSQRASWLRRLHCSTGHIHSS